MMGTGGNSFPSPADVPHLALGWTGKTQQACHIPIVVGQLISCRSGTNYAWNRLSRTLLALSFQIYLLGDFPVISGTV